MHTEELIKCIQLGQHEYQRLKMKVRKIRNTIHKHTHTQTHLESFTLPRKGKLLDLSVLARFRRYGRSKLFILQPVIMSGSVRRTNFDQFCRPITHNIQPQHPRQKNNLEKILFPKGLLLVIFFYLLHHISDSFLHDGCNLSLSSPPLHPLYISPNYPSLTITLLSLCCHLPFFG